jgi:hypothetical protein
MIRLVEFCCNNEFSALKYICQSFQTVTEGCSLTFEAPLNVVADNKGDTDVDSESSESSSSLAAYTPYTGPSFFKSSESSLGEVHNENNIPMLIDASDDEDECEKKATLPSTTTLKPIVKPLKRDSSVRNALEFAKEHQDSNIGLLKYFSQGTKEDEDMYWRREEERTAVNQEKQNFKDKSVDMDKKLHNRELARVRQQRKRDRIKGKEIKEGVRSPGGKKRKVNQIFPLLRIKLITRSRSLN